MKRLVGAGPGGMLALAALLLAGIVRADSQSTASAAAELVRQAKTHEAHHDDDLAVRRYTEALTLDPTEGDAYLGLGALRLRTGDPREATRVYDTALSHLPDLPLAWLGRAQAHRRMGALLEADVDLTTYAEATGDEAALRQLAGWYGEEGRPAAQLAVWRKLLGQLEVKGDAPGRKEARLTVRALELLVGSADPVREPGEGGSAVRRGMARAEQRRVGVKVR